MSEWLRAVFFILLLSSTDGLPATSCHGICIYEAATYHADCSNRSLSNIPDSCSSAVSLNAQGNDLGVLQSGTFANFTSLKGLDISKSGVTKIENGAFSGPLSLRKLFLNGNNVTLLQDGVFGELPDLRAMNLGDNSITSVGEGKFQNLRSLIKLTLADNLITALEADSFSGLESLSTMTLSRNLIKDVHRDAFSHMPNLEYLYLGVNKLTAFHPDTFRNLPKLKLLNLAGNRLTEIPPSIINLKSLRRLDIQDNLIQDVSPIVPSLGQFSDLYLSGNPLRCSGIPEPLAGWIQERYPDTKLECDLQDGAKMKVVSMTNTQKKATDLPDTYESSYSLDPDYRDYSVPDEGDSELISMFLYILVPITAVVMISSIVFLEYLTRQKIARRNQAMGDSEALGQVYHDGDENAARTFANDVATSHGRTLRTFESLC